jgi:hypothetical protein
MMCLFIVSNHAHHHKCVRTNLVCVVLVTFVRVSDEHIASVAADNACRHNTAANTGARVWCGHVVCSCVEIACDSS